MLDAELSPPELVVIITCGVSCIGLYQYSYTKSTLSGAILLTALQGEILLKQFPSSQNTIIFHTVHIFKNNRK